MMHGTYFGPIKALRGETALLRVAVGQSQILAQFDNWILGREFTHAWLLFDLTDWEINASEEDPCT